MFLNRDNMPEQTAPPAMADPIGTIESAIENIEKRPFDLYVLGPFLVWYGLKSRTMPRLARRILVSAGIFQIFYAWRSYREKPMEFIAKLTENNGESVST